MALKTGILCQFGTVFALFNVGSQDFALLFSPDNMIFMLGQEVMFHKMWEPFVVVVFFFLTEVLTEHLVGSGGAVRWKIEIWNSNLHRSIQQFHTQKSSEKYRNYFDFDSFFLTEEMIVPLQPIHKWELPFNL